VTKAEKRRSPACKAAKSHSKEKCTHERNYPDLQRASFFSFPKEAELQKKVSFFKEERHQKRKPNYIESHDLFRSIPRRIRIL